MRRRAFNVLTVCSATLFFALAARDFLIRDVHRSIQLCPGVCVGLTSSYGAPRVEAFNDPKSGPYRGGIIEMVAHGQQGRVQQSGFNFLDVYVRHLRWPDGKKVWTLSFGVIYIVIASATIPVIWLVRRFRRTRRGFPVMRPKASV